MGDQMKKESSRELTTEMIDRENDVAYVMGCVTEADCCSVVGVSNIGKSVLLRSLSLPVVYEKRLGATADSYVFVYVDFNLTSQMTEQGFYEVILRNVLELLEAKRRDDQLRSTIQQAYQTIIAPSSPFLVPLAFEDSLEAITDHHPGMLVLLFDEFDEVFGEIEARIFVRLRALKDRHWPRLCYVTATGRPLSDIRREWQVGEFCELFAAHTYHLAPLSEADARALVESWAEESAVQLTAKDVDFVLGCAGGHPSLLQATCRVLARAKEEAVWRPVAGHYERVREQLDSDANVRLECAKLWNDLSVQERETLILLLSGQDVTSGVGSLTEKGVVRTMAAGAQVFAGLFAGFARRQRLMGRRGPRGIRIDVEAGDVWVDGELAAMLTELEYKLLLLLYGNLDKICDKYKIVESVWGESYIDEVDDARIEKLMSRLRYKIEPVPEEPRYLITVRGRGYKLVSPE
jgi:hypothetical protein